MALSDHSLIDRVIHEPIRLVTLIHLASVPSSTFMELALASGVSKGNLGAHLKKLNQAGLITIKKSFVGNVPQTEVAITSAGRESLVSYWEHMMGLIG